MQHILDFAIKAGLKNYWQITENTFNDEFEKYSDWICYIIGFGQEFLKFDELILVYLFFCVMKCVHAKLMIIFIYLYFSLFRRGVSALIWSTHTWCDGGKSCNEQKPCYIRKIFFFLNLWDRERNFLKRERKRVRPLIYVCIDFTVN